MDHEDSQTDSGEETEDIGDLDDDEELEQINSRCSVKKMRTLASSFCDEKRKLVESMGFQGLLGTPKLARSNRGFSMWLLRHVDEQASAIDNGHLRFIPFFPEDFGKVLGIPYGGTAVGIDPGIEVISAVYKTLGISETVKKIKAIEEIAMDAFPSVVNQKLKNRFKVAYAICAVTHMLSPMLKGNYFQTFYWGALMDPELISMYDWGALVRDGILSAARFVKADLEGTKKKNKRTHIAGCTHGLQVFYIDNLELGSSNLPHTVMPRMVAYSEQLINQIICADQISGRKAEVKVFGRLLPRPDATVCYGRNKNSGFSRKGNPLSSEDIGASDPLVEKISAMLLEKVGRFTSTCQDALALTSRRGKELNRIHGEKWDSLVQETNCILASETAKLVNDINRIKDVMGNRSRDEVAMGRGGGKRDPSTRGEHPGGDSNNGNEGIGERPVDSTPLSKFGAAEPGDKSYSCTDIVSVPETGRRSRGCGVLFTTPCAGEVNRYSRYMEEHVPGGGGPSGSSNLGIGMTDRGGGANRLENDSTDAAIGAAAYTYCPGSALGDGQCDGSVGKDPAIIGKEPRGSCGYGALTQQEQRHGGRRMRIKRVTSRGNIPKRKTVCPNKVVAESDPADVNLESLIDAIAVEQRLRDDASSPLNINQKDILVEDPESKRRRMQINNLEIPSMELFSDEERSPQIHGSRGLRTDYSVCGDTDKRHGIDVGKRETMMMIDDEPHREDPRQVVIKGLVSVIEIPDDPEPSTGLEMVLTPSTPSGARNLVPEKSPVSRNREVAALELAYREEMENTSLNLNLDDGEVNLSSQLMNWRRVKPGPCAKSPFVLGYEPPVRAPSGAVKFYDAFFREKGDNLRNNWIISSQPKYIEISGHLLQSMLREKGSLETEFVNLAMRRYQQLDIAFAEANKEGCWRLFLEADFANHVFRGDAVSKLKYIYDLFRGPSITFEVHRCTEIVLLVRFEASWSTYIWDFQEEQINILDPTMNNGDSSDKVKQSRHRSIATELHRALGECIAVFFDGWEPLMKDWDVSFPKGLTMGVCDSNDSGIYALHFARNWTGTRLKKSLSSNGDRLIDSRRILLVETLSIEGNIGHIPEKYRKCLLPLEK